MIVKTHARSFKQVAAWQVIRILVTIEPTAFQGPANQGRGDGPKASTS